MAGPDPAADDRGLDVGAFIRQQRQLARVTLRGLSEAAGVSNPYLSQIERGLRRPSAEILRQIAHALVIPAETLFVRAGILDEPTGAVDVIGAINADPDLDDEQKRALTHIYRSFRDQSAARGTAPAGDPATAAPDRAAVPGDDGAPVAGGDGPGSSAAGGATAER